MDTVSNARSWAQIAGLLLTLASLGFIALLLWSQRHVLVNFRPGPGTVVALVLSSVAYAAAGLLLASAWRFLLHWSGEAKVCSGESRRIYARTQLAKYIPGNFAQLLGRHIGGRQAGWSHVSLIASAVFELASLLSVGALIAMTGLVATGIQAKIIGIPALIGLVVGLIGVFLLVLRLGPSLIVRRSPELASRLAEFNVFALWPVALRHASFFLLGGIILLLVSRIVVGSTLELAHWPGIISLFAIAWTAGVITPGAPSGIGVREAVLVLGLSPIAPAALAVLVAALFRLITVGGDLLFFLSLGKRK